MGQLLRAATTAAVLAAALALAHPARAETAAPCYQTLNAYRARAGVGPAAPGTLPALAAAAANHATYRVNVDPGDASLLTELGLPDLGLFGPDANAHLETPALRQLGFTGVNPWDRTAAANLLAGRWRYQYEDVTTATGIALADLQAVRSWVDAPYHRLPLLDANTRHVGCSGRQRVVNGRLYTAQVLNMAATWADTTRRITLYPAPGQTGVPASFNRCQEQPTPFGGPCDPARPVQDVGYVITVQADGYHAMRVQGMALTRAPAGTPVTVHRAVRYRTTRSSVPTSSVDANLPPNAAMLAATTPLEPGTTYNVRVSGQVQATRGGSWKTFTPRTWSFTTA